ncbi:lysylphosphatidylglycerol synthase transmembrane domain-containing protein [Winogradskya humida]|uniref:Membrane protein n=1 Tax=Winogradskya humida TaxID=113566 RepID=A0ABQ3ZMX0_9ACTN|nr:lysylphosphatidylglycerol synthase transmembrane domain-containing protein [Actinoplanes humidus]GIE19872.1 membrane protein [Actinoplanes humidus]
MADTVQPWWRRGPVVAAAVLAVLAVELVFGWRSLVEALGQLRTPHWNWVAGALVAEIASMGSYARMQRALLRGAGTKVGIRRHVALAYAAHSLSATLPGGPLFSTTFNFQHLRRFGASSAVASWCIALSGVLSAGALVVIGAVFGILTRSTGSWRTLLVYMGGALLVAVGVRLVAQHPEWLINPARMLLGLLNRVRHRPVDTGQAGLTSFIDQLRSVRMRPAELTYAILLAVANWLLDALCLWMCCIALDAEGIHPSQLVIAYCAGMAAASVPIVPGGLGVVDGALILGLVAGGLATGSAVAAVVLYRLISFVFVIGTGWLVWLVMRSRAGTPPGVMAR